MSEKRKHVRIREESGIAVKILMRNEEERSDKGGTFLRLTKDISRGGLRFSNATKLEVDTTLQIHLVLDLPRKIVTHIGTVRWTEQLEDNGAFSIGVEFTETSDLDNQIWQHYIDTKEDVDR